MFRPNPLSVSSTFAEKIVSRIVNYIVMTALTIHELPKLLSRPLCRRMICSIDMQNMARAYLDRDKHVHHPERSRY
jgi:hypothetical protein